MLPLIPEVIVVMKLFMTAKAKVMQLHLMRVSIEPDAARAIEDVVLAVN